MKIRRRVEVTDTEDGKDNLGILIEATTPEDEEILSTLADFLEAHAKHGTLKQFDLTKPSPYGFSGFSADARTLFVLSPFQDSVMCSLLERVLCLHGYHSDLLSDPNESQRHLEHLRTLARWLYGQLKGSY